MAKRYGLALAAAAQMAALTFGAPGPSSHYAHADKPKGTKRNAKRSNIGRGKKKFLLKGVRP